MKAKWKVTLWRIGSGGGYAGYGRTIQKAFADAATKAGDPYLFGISGADGHRFGPDLFSTFIDCCERAAKLIRGHTSCRHASAENSARSAAVDIERVK